MSATATVSEQAKQTFKAVRMKDTSSKPKALPVDASNIPSELKTLDRWVVWNYKLEKLKDGGTKWGKPPIGKSNDPTTWSSFGRALDSICDGIGIAFGELEAGRYLCGVDVDNCRDPFTGSLSDEALGIIKLLGSYTEVSPSGTGIKVFCYADCDVFAQRAKQIGDLENYSTDRFFFVTGHRLPCSPVEVRECTASLKEFNDVYMIRKNEIDSDPTDPDLARLALGQLSPDRANDYHSWISAGMALRSVDDGLLDAWDTWSQQSDKYAPGGCASKWKTFSGNNLKLGSLLYWAKQDTGWVPPRKEKKYTAPVDGEYPLTDGGNARRFIAEYGQDVRYCLERRKWLVWDGKRWKLDLENNKVMRLAKRTIKGIREAAAKITDKTDATALWKFANQSDNESRYNSMLALAESEDGIAIEVAELDNQPWLFNCKNGTIDLKTGELLEHSRSDYITKLCPLDYAADEVPMPLWTSFLGRIFADDRDLIGFMQRLMGMSLSGGRKEHVLPIFYGNGANGKGTLTETWMEVMGSDYADAAPSELLVGGKGEHPTIFADLQGKRLMAASETKDGCALNEATVKKLTGQDTIKARGMREDFYSFKPSHTLVLATNHRPIVRGTDYGIWRRLKLVPFTVTIPAKEQDLDLLHKMSKEHGAILRWLVEGCLAWQAEGLQAPEAVEVATADYKADSDLLTQFIEECCDVGCNLEDRSSTLYAAYEAFCKRRGETLVNSRVFGQRLSEKGFERDKRGGNNLYKGIRSRVGIELLNATRGRE